jgi:hypothetical protein
MDPPDLARLEAEETVKNSIAKKRQKRIQQLKDGRIPLPEMRFVERWSKNAILQGLVGCPEYDPVLKELKLPTSKTIYDEYWRRGPRPDRVLPFEKRALAVERRNACFAAQEGPASFVSLSPPLTSSSYRSSLSIQLPASSLSLLLPPSTTSQT